MKKKGKSSFKKSKTLSVVSGLSGTLSFLGGWQICHNLCLGIIALLSIIGITVAGMPLLFLTQYAIYFWSVAALLLMPTLIMYWKNRKCMSSRLLLLNLGIVISAVPFSSTYHVIFWLAGGAIILLSILMFVKSKLS